MAWVGQLAGLTFVKGGPVDFVSSARNNAVFVLEAWATWCPPCRQSVPHLSEIQRKFRDKNVLVVGITEEADVKKIEKFVAGMGHSMDYAVAVDAGGTFRSLFMDNYNVQGIPHAFVAAPSGDVVWHGHPMDPAMEPAIDQAVRSAAKANVATLSDEALHAMHPRELKSILQQHGVDYTGCAEKGELVALIKEQVQRTAAQ